ncbi:uncharacterized protein M421DRAFT_868 [Didymella exigua CBS 183.55]|uniref:Uncharacterized protein n=1 Tax=Didymella exigua CBS 183.55 TaxID=1150837 RepID=A0A6A5RYM3_9PLEO|nr:uncharacterized protein M421DRAFT_868 [Didymella exigua CBS 183.55]KAF1933461.1 hypothetical protein M421DRAFT_868 [Didymella exigua CBS 183.55]
MLPTTAFLTFTVLMASALAGPNTGPAAGVDGSLALRDAEPLPDNAVAQAACKCRKGTKQGQYCGYCYEVLSPWVADNVYECNKEGGCYDYKYRKSCAKREGPCG